MKHLILWPHVCATHCCTLLITTQEMCLDFLKPNLHYLVCQLTEQALAMGSTRGLLELWVERMMGFGKRKTKFRATSDPEKGLCYDVELWRCQKLLKSGARNVLELDELLPPYGMRNSVQYRNADEESSSSDGSFLIGPGQSFDERKHGMDLSMLLSMVHCEILVENSDSANGWTEDMLSESSVSVFVYVRAMLKGRDIVNGRLYGQERARDSSHVSAVYESGGGEAQQHIACIQYFVLIESLTGIVDVPLRFAVARFYDYVPPYVDNDVGVVHKANLRQFEGSRYGGYHPVVFSSITSTLMYCTEGDVRRFVPYRIHTGKYLTA